MPEALTILIVDDEPNMLITLSDILSIHGHDVFTAGDGYQAVDLAKKEKFDVLLMDLKMPGMNGIEAFRAIKKIDPSIKCVFITAHYDKNLIRDASAEGIGGIFQKPLNIPQLLDYIKTAVGEA